MDIKITKHEETITLVEITGMIESSTTPIVEEELFNLIQPGCAILLDLSRVRFLSSAGLRMLFNVNRAIRGAGGKVAAAGVREEIRETMELTGFLDYFTLYPTREEGLVALGA